MPQGGAPSEDQRRKLPLILEAVSRWQRDLRARRVPYVELDLPHRAAFEAGKLTPEEAIDVYWRCVRTAPRTLEGRAKRFIARVLQRHHGNLSRAAKDLRIHRNTLGKKIEEYKLDGGQRGS